MKRFLLDTNVVIDIACKRAPWFQDAVLLLQANAHKHIQLAVSASSITDVYYVCNKIAPGSGFKAIRLCMRHLSVLSVGGRELHRALELQGADFEDNLQIACAELHEVDAIITRDASGFTHAPLPALSPTEALAGISNS